ncbi:hypothetical protein EXIGLDRAFT_234843 [Exidia glandulosa HHB12029]|uniref:GH16 domain-containing protein n=1 Tax=Exidia glandulosa HHB12029 TaxID=1314781 RepID=A0A165ML70_EXIGL|nr:hypothetical protein EXIGLDRAFT_234843 [Exidia glandulosa HHB12029]
MMRTALLVAAGASLVSAKSYNLHQYSGGKNFFDGWNYPGAFDTTNNAPTADVTNSGDNWIANKTYSQSAGLTTVNDQGHAVLRVDDTSTVVYNDKRYSVRIESSELYSIGSVFVMDAVHIPFGCSVWPAYWTSAEVWPEGGEIDILENVNQATNNQMALHTHGTCTISPESTGTAMTGSVVFEDCGNALNGNTGCVVRDPSTKSFGKDFNSNQGGMWVTEFAEDAISIWFFSRADIPASLKSDANSTSIDTSALGTPVARYPNTNCDIKSLFAPQKIVINITLCGVFARPTFNSTCPATQENSCYLDWVIGPPANYTEAYFEIVSHRVFTDTAAAPPTPNPSGTPGGSSDNSSSGTGTGTGTGGGDGTGAAIAAGVGSVTLAALVGFAIAMV